MSDPYNKKDIIFNVNGETLIGSAFGEIKSDITSFLFLHGGKNPASNIYYLNKKLQDKGISSFTFDHSGHGESSGKLGNSSLEKRVQEAKIAINISGLKEPINICAFSMGGHIAIKLTEIVNVNTLVLFCPAAYTKKAFDVQFDQGFTEVIREKESWKNSDCYQILEKFKGNLLIIIGKEDKLIPKELLK